MPSLRCAKIYLRAACACCALLLCAAREAALADDTTAAKTPAKPVQTTQTAKSTRKPPVRRAVKRAPPKHVATKPAKPAEPPPESDDPEAVKARQQEQAQQRDELVARLAELKREISTSEASRSEAADALAASERAISDSNRKLHDLGEQRHTVEARLEALNQDHARTAQTIATQQEQLARLLHDQYEANSADPLKLLLSGDDPQRLEREITYRGYVAHAEALQVEQLQQNLAQLKQLSEQTAARDAELAGISRDEEATRSDLVHQQATHQATLAQISEKLQTQRAQAGALERDEKRLTQIVEELGKLIERQAREARERERQRQLAREKEEEARRAAQLAAGKSATPVNPPSHNPPAIASAAPSAGSFAALRGKMQTPLAGEQISRFGTARGAGGPSWKGIFIRGDQGAAVHAVAPGRVVFAEWLRGFGNLLIIDHGDEYLSIYGNNESVLKQPGDHVQAGEVVATVGDSGGNDQTGLYFELRYQGKPFDPQGWLAPR